MQNKTPRIKPSHFLAIPLYTSSGFRARVSSFQNHLQSSLDPSIRGLDPSIVIHPMKLHLTLGVMTLVGDSGPSESSGKRSTKRRKWENDEEMKSESSTDPTRTVTAALELLRSLKPRIDVILGKVDTSVQAPMSVEIEKMDIMRRVKAPRPLQGEGTSLSKTTKEPQSEKGKYKEDAVDSQDLIWADVLYLAPRESGPDGQKFRQVCDLVLSTFKAAGFITERRPLKLHCTILNTSHRKPQRRDAPFCYSDVLKCSEAMEVLGATPSRPLVPILGKNDRLSASTAVRLDLDTAVIDSGNGGSVNQHSLPWTSVGVHEIGLWIMGSRRPEDGAYVSAGDVKLGRPWMK